LLDLKTSNLLIDEGGTIKVADFGLSEMRLGSYLKDRDHAKGTPLYMSPEVMMFQCALNPFSPDHRTPLSHVSLSF